MIMPKTVKIITSYNELLVSRESALLQFIQLQKKTIGCLICLHLYHIPFLYKYLLHMHFMTSESELPTQPSSQS